MIVNIIDQIKELSDNLISDTTIQQAQEYEDVQRSEIVSKITELWKEFENTENLLKTKETEKQRYIHAIKIRLHLIRIFCLNNISLKSFRDELNRKYSRDINYGTFLNCFDFKTQTVDHITLSTICRYLEISFDLFCNMEIDSIEFVRKSKLMKRMEGNRQESMHSLYYSILFLEEPRKSETITIIQKNSASWSNYDTYSEVICLFNNSRIIRQGELSFDPSGLIKITIERDYDETLTIIIPIDIDNGENTDIQKVLIVKKKKAQEMTVSNGLFSNNQIPDNLSEDIIDGILKIKNDTHQPFRIEKNTILNKYTDDQNIMDFFNDYYNQNINDLDDIISVDEGIILYQLHGKDDREIHKTETALLKLRSISNTPDVLHYNKNNIIRQQFFEKDNSK